MVIAHLFVFASALLSAGFAAPQATQNIVRRDWTTTATLYATVTLNTTTTYVTTVEPTATTTSTSTSWPTPTYTATEIYAIRPGSAIHLLSVQALGGVLRLGGSSGAYCPTSVDIDNGCPDSNFTGFEGCSLSVTVPGGQAIYMKPDGQVRFSEPHSALIDPGSIPCPLSFSPLNNSDAVCVTTSAFGSTGLMACPMLDSTDLVTQQQWQVYGNINNASVPLMPHNGTAAGCLEFEAVGIEKIVQNYAAAWSYF